MIEVELPDGTVVEFPDGTAPDTIKGALSKYKPAAAPAVPKPREAGLLERAGTAVQAAIDQPGEALKGAGKGLAGSLLGAAQLAQKVSPHGVLQELGVLPKPVAQQQGEQILTDAQQFYKPSNPAQQTGQFVEKAAEFFVPAGLGLRAAKGAGLAANAAREALGTGAVSAVQSGGDPLETALGAAVGGAAPVLGAGASKVGKGAGEKLMATLIRPLERNTRFGADPAKAVVEEGLTGATLPRLGKAVAKRASEVGEEVKQFVSRSEVANKKVSLAKVHARMEDAIREATDFGETGLAKQISRLRKAKAFSEEEVSPAVAVALKQQFSKFINWGAKSKKNLNQTKQQIVGELNDAIEAAVPGVRTLNRHWGDLIEARKAIAARRPVAQRGGPLSLGDIVLGTGLGYQQNDPMAGVAAVVGKRAMGSALLRSQLAKYLARAGGEGSALLALLRPYLASGHPGIDLTNLLPGASATAPRPSQ